LAGAGGDVVGVDFDETVVTNLQQGRAPVAEPGLDELIARGLAAGRLHFASEAAAISKSEIVWITYDTPVDDDDRADVDVVVERIAQLFPHLADRTLLLVSSQVPVGTVSRLEAMYRATGRAARVTFACSPENLRLGKAIAVFQRPDRVVVGARDAADRPRLQ